MSSDIDDEIRLSVLDPNLVGQGTLTRQGALDQLISRALIEQQIREEDMQAIEPSQEEVNARLDQIRRQLPACVHQNCATDAGWKAFLSAHGLTPERVESYLRYRLEILSFIEQRFRQGIQISPQQIEELLPRHAASAVHARRRLFRRWIRWLRAFRKSCSRQQVNVLFDAWLTNLRSQGDVEVLDPSLEDPSLEARRLISALNPSQCNPPRIQVRAQS